MVGRKPRINPEMESKSEFEPTKYIPYLALPGELWYVFYKDFEENWPHYNGTALYNIFQGPMSYIGSIHYKDIIMSATASQITGLMIVYSMVYAGLDQRKHQSSASLAFVRGIHRWPVTSPRKGPVTPKMFPFDDVIMLWQVMRVSITTRDAGRP